MLSLGLKAKFFGLGHCLETHDLGLCFAARGLDLELALLCDA